MLAAALLPLQAAHALPGAPDISAASLEAGQPTAVRQFIVPAADRPWPFNGRITNRWDRPVEVWSDTRGRFLVEPGETTPVDEDVDYASIDGRWYKIGLHHLQIDGSGQVTGFTCLAHAAGGSCV